MQQANELYYYFHIIVSNPSECIFAVWNLLTFELQPAHYDLWLSVCRHCEEFQRISSSSIKLSVRELNLLLRSKHHEPHTDGIPGTHHKSARSLRFGVRHVNGRCNAMKGRQKEDEEGGEVERTYGFVWGGVVEEKKGRLFSSVKQRMENVKDDHVPVEYIISCLPEVFAYENNRHPKILDRNSRLLTLILCESLSYELKTTHFDLPFILQHLE